ncbi:MAG: ABC transporter ATP-binding protein [Clostridia bacterium]|nr:ABC transporter ATP-binding protein [Clostridia bacterium]NLS84125.1 ABC transporter ATP-binding protein [Oscillospiraceae bacterium]
MLKIRRYMKPYISLLVVAVALLFGQALMNLELPNMMSDIVNNGIQKGGITECAPKAISDTSMQLMQTFMTDDEKTLVNEHYSANTDGSANEKYPNATEKTLVENKVDKDTQAKLDTAFAHASYAFVQVMSDVAEQSGKSMSGGSDSSNATLDMSAMAQVLPMLAMLPDGTVQKAIDVSAATADTMTTQTGAIIAKSLYVELGADTDSIQTSYIWAAGVKMILFCLMVVACAIGAGYCLSRFGAGIARDLRGDVFKRVTSFTNNEMDKFSTASLITRSTNDITQVQMFFTMGLRMLCFAPIMGIGGLVMALRKSTSMAWLLALAVILLLCLIGTLLIVAVPKFKKMQTLVDRLNLVSRESLSGMMVIRAFATQDFEEKRFDDANNDLTSNTLFVNRAMAVMMPFMTLIMNGLMLLIVWVGAHQISESSMQVGDMMAFMQYAMHVVMSFLFVSMMFVMLPRASVSAERISEVLDTKSTVTDPEQPKHLPADLSASIKFDDVSFRYEGAEEDVLSHISFTAQPGQTTAFIGSTGSGKSTLINLIPRFYDVTQGSIKIDGVDIRDITQHELRERIGYVPQKGVLFTGDINSNLRYGNADASEELIVEAAKVAQADDFVQKLDDGYETSVAQGGTNVSGGQRQRLSIARALVKKSPIYIFDDTFSALDFKTDATLRKALKGYTTNATVLIVAQRISTIMTAEQIVVLDEGKIAGIGTHKELLKTCKTYREIAQSQLTEEELA